jgi:hypothetical protein
VSLVVLARLAKTVSRPSRTAPASWQTGKWITPTGWTGSTRVSIAGRFSRAGRRVSAQHGPARSVPNPGLIAVGAVRAAGDADPQPDGAYGLAASPGPVVGVMLPLHAVLGAVAAPIPIRIHQRFGAPSRDQRKDMHRRVGVMDTFLVLIRGSP